MRLTRSDSPASRDRGPAVPASAGRLPATSPGCQPLRGCALDSRALSAARPGTHGKPQVGEGSLSGHAMALPRVFSQVRAVMADESACTPGSVPQGPYGPWGGGHPSRTDVAAGLVRSTRGLGRAALDRPRRAAGRRLLLTLLRVGFTEPSESPRTLVVSYTTVSPLPGSLAAPGGLFSVALSRGSPRVGVTHHPAVWSPDVPRRDPEGPRRDRPAGSSAVVTMLPGPCGAPDSGGDHRKSAVSKVKEKGAGRSIDLPKGSVWASR